MQDNQEVEEVDMGSPSTQTIGDKQFSDFISKFETDARSTESDEIISAALGETDGQDSSFDPTNGAAKETEALGESSTETGNQEANQAEVGAQNSGLTRLANKEKEVRELISKFETEKKELLSRPDPKILADQLRLYPEKVLASLGIDTEMVMKTILYNKLEDSNPAKGKLREQLKEMETNKKFHELEEKLASKERAIAQQEKYQEILTGAERYVEDIGKSAVHEKTYPTLSKLAKADGKVLHARIMKEIETDAVARYARGESGDPLSYDEAATRVESDLAVLSRLLTGSAANGLAQKQVPSSQSNSNSNVRPPASPIVKKDLSIEDLEERAIKNAIVEYHKHQARSR